MNGFSIFTVYDNICFYLDFANAQYMPAYLHDTKVNDY